MHDYVSYSRFDGYTHALALCACMFTIDILEITLVTSDNEEGIKHDWFVKCDSDNKLI